MKKHFTHPEMERLYGDNPVSYSMAVGSEVPTNLLINGGRTESIENIINVCAYQLGVTYEALAALNPLLVYRDQDDRHNAEGTIGGRVKRTKGRVPFLAIAGYGPSHDHPVAEILLPIVGKIGCGFDAEHGIVTKRHYHDWIYHRGSGYGIIWNREVYPSLDDLFDQQNLICFDNVIDLMRYMSTHSTAACFCMMLGRHSNVPPWIACDEREGTLTLCYGICDPIAEDNVNLWLEIFRNAEAKRSLSVAFLDRTYPEYPEYLDGNYRSDFDWTNDREEIGHGRLSEDRFQFCNRLKMVNGKQRLDHDLFIRHWVIVDAGCDEGHKYVTLVPVHSENDPDRFACDEHLQRLDKPVKAYVSGPKSEGKPKIVRDLFERSIWNTYDERPLEYAAGKTKSGNLIGRQVVASVMNFRNRAKVTTVWKINDLSERRRKASVSEGVLIGRRAIARGGLFAFGETAGDCETVYSHEATVTLGDYW